MFLFTTSLRNSLLDTIKLIAIYKYALHNNSRVKTRRLNTGNYNDTFIHHEESKNTTEWWTLIDGMSLVWRKCDHILDKKCQSLE